MAKIVHQRQTLHLGVFAPASCPCPRCGAPSPLNEVRAITKRVASLEGPVQEVFDLGCYLCPACPDGERWFRLSSPGFEESGVYSRATRAAVVRLVTQHKMSFDGAATLASDLLNLPGLAGTTVMRWFRAVGEGVDERAHLAAAAAVFSGQLAIDEVYDAPYWVVRVTDPVKKIEVMTLMGAGSPTADDIADVLCDLRGAGFEPEVIATDASSLYPAVIQEIFPSAKHQLCVFHFVKSVNEKLGRSFRAIIAETPAPKKRRRGRPKKRGRPRKDAQKRQNIQVVRRCRYAIFRRELSSDHQAALDAAYALCPKLRVLRRFIDAMYAIFAARPTRTDAEVRRTSILADLRFAEVASLLPSIAQLQDHALFEKLTVSLDFTNADRTSNHAERENREFRKRQLSHYCLRTVRSMKAFLGLMTIRRPPPMAARRLNRRQTPAVASTNEGVVAA
jgi:hypothetical protein